MQLDGLLAGLTAAKLPKNVFSTFIDNLISEAEQFSTFTQDQLQNFSAPWQSDQTASNAAPCKTLLLC